MKAWLRRQAQRIRGHIYGFAPPPRASGHPYLAGAPLLIAHRGGAALAPENTLAAFRQAVEWWRADIIELDVQTTRDGHAVVIHDDTVDRTTDGTGKVADLLLAEVRRLDAGYRFSADDGESYPFRGEGVQVSTLEEVLRALPHARVNVEIKDPRAQRSVQMAVEHTAAWGRVLIASDQWRSKRLFRNYRGARSGATEELYLFHFLTRLRLSRFFPPITDCFQVPERHRGRQVVSEGWVRAAHARNLPVHIWTVNDERDMRRLLTWNVDGIITDRPDKLGALLHELCGRERAPGPPPGAAPYLEYMLRN